LICHIQAPEGACSLRREAVGRGVRHHPVALGGLKPDAIAPYDFKVVPRDGPPRRIDAKSTSSGFLNPIHISLGELFAATEGDLPYDIYRVFKVTESSAVLRVAKNVGPALRPVQEGLGALPEGVVADSLSINTNILPFDAAEIAIYLPEEGAENN